LASAQLHAIEVNVTFEVDAMFEVYVALVTIGKPKKICKKKRVKLLVKLFDVVHLVVGDWSLAYSLACRMVY
jgi:hypothetical protein